MKFILSYTVFVIFIFIICSCNLTSKPYGGNDLIVGEWRAYNTIETDSIWSNIIFFKDNSCQVTPGFYNYHNEEHLVGITYLGSYTKFAIDSQNVNIFDIGKNKWVIFKINKLSLDSLILYTNENDQIIYTKVDEKPKVKNDFDAIIFLNTGSYKNDQILGLQKYFSEYSILLDRNGKLEMNYIRNFYISSKKECKVEKQLVDSIFNLFEKLDILKLQDEYKTYINGEVNYNHKEISTVAFFKKNKVIKEIEISEYNIPIDLYLALDPIRTLYNSGRCVNIDSYYNNLNANITGLVYTCDESKYLVFSKAEDFFVKQKINKAKEINGRINDIYKLESDLGYIFSDGRFIRITGSPKIYDVGYNFLDLSRFKLVKQNKNEIDY